MMTNRPLTISIEKALRRSAKPIFVNNRGSPGRVSHSKKSTDKKTANAANNNNRAILIIMDDWCLCLSVRYCTQFIVKILNS